MRSWPSAARDIARVLGIDVNRHSRSFEARRDRIFRDAGISLVVDVGANEGQYAREIRREGYSGRILSVEPLTDCFRTLAAASRRVDGWECVNVALGREAGNLAINISGNRVSSSFLPILTQHVRSAPESAYERTEAVEIRTLDSVAEGHRLDTDAVAVKLDVQGYELEVLCGGVDLMEYVSVLEIELSLVELYGGQPLYREVIEYLERYGFDMVALTEGFTCANTGRVLQFNAIFRRNV